jgi:predicted transposase/invertase (TIGR01784 family)
MANDEILIPAILPAYDDGVFKAILTHPEAMPVLRDVVSSVLLIPVHDVEVRNAELPITDISDKRERFDVNCKTDSGEQAEIEMQADPMEGDSAANWHAVIKSRAIYNLCDLHSSQPSRGTRYDKLMRSFQVTFCGYLLFGKREEGFVNRFSFRNEAGEELSGAVGIIFVELARLGKTLKKPAGEMTPLEMWAAFFAVAHKPEYRRLLDEMSKTREEIFMARELLTNISSDEIQRAHFRSRRLYEMDRESERIIIRDEATAAGMAKGMAKGEAKGVAKGVAKVALKLLKRNRPIEEIMEDTGFTRTEIENLSRQ